LFMAKRSDWKWK